jgi:hypothetical protein
VPKGFATMGERVRAARTVCLCLPTEPLVSISFENMAAQIAAC